MAAYKIAEDRITKSLVEINRKKKSHHNRWHKLYEAEKLDNRIRKIQNRKAKEMDRTGKRAAFSEKGPVLPARKAAPIQ